MAYNEACFVNYSKLFEIIRALLKLERKQLQGKQWVNFVTAQNSALFTQTRKNQKEKEATGKKFLLTAQNWFF